MSLILKNLYFINKGDKMKRTLLDDFIKIYNSINCDSEYCSCNECSNKDICELVGNILNSMRNHYYKSTRKYYKNY